ncbi:MAG TPA: hypothetical protein VHE10_02590 [Candidatus Paceibacterota bacterium]|nr:hypothetical protein [Candidatus Paceibacterota bacterium]
MGESNGTQGHEDSIKHRRASIAARQRKEKTFLLEKLRETPVIEVACKKAGISRATFYRWYHSDKRFKKMADEAGEYSRRFMNDMCESQIISLIRERKMPAISFWLSHNDPRYMKAKEVKPHQTVDPAKETTTIATENVRNFLIEGDKMITRWFMQKYMPNDYGTTPREKELLEKLDFHNAMQGHVDINTLSLNIQKALMEQREKDLQELIASKPYRDAKLAELRQKIEDENKNQYKPRH